MATATLTITVHVKLPWWWRLYLAVVIFSHNCRVIDADPAVAIEFVLRHTRIYTKDRDGRVCHRERLSG